MVNVVEYGRFTVQAGRVPLFGCEPLATVSWSEAEAEAPMVSMARTVKPTIVAAALAGGTPVSRLPFSVNQEGRLDAIQVSAPVPPAAVKETLYVTPGVAGGSGEVVVMVTAGFTVTLSDCALLDAPVASIAATEKLYGVLAATTGAMPVSDGPFKDSQAGRLVPLHVNVGVPPVTARDCEYGTPDVMAASEVVVTDGGGLIASVKALVVAASKLSTALIVN